MRIKEVVLYKFDELPPERQKKEIDEHGYILVDTDWWYESVLANWYEKLKTQGFDVPKNGIVFELYSQGSGAAFKARVDVIRFLEAHDKTNRFPRIKEHYKEGKFDISISQDGRYTHTGTMNVEISSNYEDEQENTDDIKDLVETAMEDGALALDKVAELGEWILEVAKDNAKQIEKDLYEEYDYLTTDEAIKEHLIDNEMEFE